MSGFKDKSEQNKNAGEALIKQSLYASSIHCFYYSCVQNILHILFSKLKIDPTKFENERRQAKNGTHGWASKLIDIEIAKVSLKDYKIFQKEFAEIRTLREKSDYSDKGINSDEGLIAKNKALSLTVLLNRTFK